MSSLTMSSLTMPSLTMPSLTMPSLTMPSLTAALLRRTLPTCLAASLTLALTPLALTTPSEAAPISYTGQLLSGGNPVGNSHYDFQFSLYSAATGGTQVGSTITVTSIPVVDGIFYAEPDFGAVALNQTLYLQTAYRQSGGGAYTTQTPRKLIPTTPEADYALVSGSANGLQGRGVSAAAPATGQALTWTGSLWTPQSAAAYTAGAGLHLTGTTFAISGGGVTASMLHAGAVTAPAIALPLSLTESSGGAALSVANNGSGTALSGLSNSSTGNGVYGEDNLAGASGVYGYSDSGNGVYGGSTVGAGVRGSNNASGDYGLLGGVEPITGTSYPTGVFGYDPSQDGFGVDGYSVSGAAVNGSSSSGIGVSGSSANYIAGYFSTSNGNLGAYGESDKDGGGIGVEGLANSGSGAIGVYGVSASGAAGYFLGNVTVTGTLTAGTKDFKIDHPLDPAGKYLSHACVESNEMADLYSGNAVTDASGNAVVTMPDWFQALNKDFRYQLTVIGQFAQAAIAAKMQGNRFAIKTDKPGVEVSWQVTGIRQDAYAAAHPLPVEEDKPAAEQGLYLHPKEWGQPEELGIGYARQQTRKARQVKRP